MNRVFPALVLCISAPMTATAADLEFRTYTEALDTILGPAVDLFGCPGLLNLPAGDPPPPEFDDLSEDLQRHCIKAFNFTYGGSLGGGFASPLSTRTYLPFSTRGVQATTGGSSATSQIVPPTGSDESISSQGTLTRPGDPRVFRAGEGVFGDTPIAVYFALDYANIEYDETEFEAGGDETRFSAGIAVEAQVTDDFSAGLSLSIGRRERDQSGGGLFLNDLRALDAFDPSPTIVNAFNDQCADIGNREQNTSNLGLSVYGLQQLGARSVLQVSASATWERNEYRFPLCISSQNDFDEAILYGGEIEGDFETFQAEVSAVFQSTFDLGGAFLVPSIGITASRNWVPEYTEGENAPLKTVTAEFDGITYNVPVNPTGATLKYEERIEDSLESTLGLLVGVPVLNDRSLVWAGASYTHQFITDAQTIEARFSGDNRDDPTTFSFETNPLDPDYFEVSIGTNIFVSDTIRIGLWGSRVLGNEYHEESRVGAFLDIAF